MTKLKLKFQVDGYLKRTSLGTEGNKDFLYSYSAKDALKLAKIELMSRDLNNHLPVLLRTTIEVSPNHGKKESSQRVSKNPQTKATIKRKTADI